MTLASRIAQTLALIAITPVLLAWSLLMLGVTVLGATAQSIRKVWR